jgi:hypothetical protein
MLDGIDEAYGTHCGCGAPMTLRSVIVERQDDWWVVVTKWDTCPRCGVTP